MLSRVVVESPPRRVLVSYPAPLVLFTDGAFDLLDGSARLGMATIILFFALGLIILWTTPYPADQPETRPGGI